MIFKIPTFLGPRRHKSGPRSSRDPPKTPPGPPHLAPRPSRTAQNSAKSRPGTPPEGPRLFFCALKGDGGNSTAPAPYAPLRETTGVSGQVSAWPGPQPPGGHQRYVAVLLLEAARVWHEPLRTSVREGGKRGLPAPPLSPDALGHPGAVSDASARTTRAMEVRRRAV